MGTTQVCFALMQEDSISSGVMGAGGWAKHQSDALGFGAEELR